MGLLSDIFDFLSSFDEGSSYIEDAKEWGDKVWNSSSKKKVWYFILISCR